MANAPAIRRQGFHHALLLFIPIAILLYRVIPKEPVAIPTTPDEVVDRPAPPSAPKPEVNPDPTGKPVPPVMSKEDSLALFIKREELNGIWDGIVAREEPRRVPQLKEHLLRSCIPGNCDYLIHVLLEDIQMQRLSMQSRCALVGWADKWCCRGIDYELEKHMVLNCD